MRDHWLARPSTVTLLWRLFIGVLVLVLVAELFVEYGHYFGLESFFGVAAWLGFLACVGMVMFAKLLGLLLKRPDDYYDR